MSIKKVKNNMKNYSEILDECSIIAKDRQEVEEARKLKDKET